MSCSRRRPYGTCFCWGGFSSKKDKQFANRSARRKQNQTLRMTEEFEDFLLPHRYECANNDVWGWVRDGKQRYKGPGSGVWKRSLSNYYRVEQKFWQYESEKFFYEEDENIWPPDWYLRLQRK